MPLLSDLDYVRNYLTPETRESIENEVAKRKSANQNFVIPSKVSSICWNLKPGRQIAIADRDENYYQRRKSSLFSPKSPTVVQNEFERSGDGQKTEKQSSTLAQQQDVSNKAENDLAKVIEQAKPIAKNYVTNLKFNETKREFPRVCSTMAMEKSKTSSYNDRLYNRNMQSDFITGCLYTRNRMSAR